MLRYVSAALLAAALVGTTAHTASGVRLPTLDGVLVDPFQMPSGTKAIVLTFVSVDCPISNRYAPELRRLYDRFASQGVLFRLIYPNPADSPDTIRRHLKEYGYQGQALRDPRHELVTITNATVTPEAAVYATPGQPVYRGRIDDRYVNPGLQRAQPTRRDLEDALSAVLAGKPVPQARVPAVGCFISDFLR
jgi:AhpC/TSA family protein